MVCPKCGKRFKVSEVRQQFEICMLMNEGLDINYDSDFSVRMCFDCSYDEFDKACGPIEEEILEYDPEELECEESGCVACGNPNYPMCMDSCSLYY